MKVEVISRDTIKPSSPTPDHLRKIEFSFLDQIATPVFMPMIFFYPKHGDEFKVKISEILKKSLSKTLTQFYPLAGRVKDNAFIACNDDGVHFLEAIAKCKLSEVTDQSADPEELNKLLPYELDNVGELILAIQINTFECGGVAVGVCISHKIADALSLVMFLNNWASAARGGNGDGEDMVAPRFELAKLFPTRNIGEFKPSTGIVKEKIVTKRFIFSAAKIATLRSKYAQNGGTRPTRVEALSAFIWSRFIAATQGKVLDPEKLYTILHAVNLRPRMEPALPDYYFGNISRFAITLPSTTTGAIDSDEDFYNLVGEMRNAIKEINGDYVKMLQEGEGHLSFMKSRARQIARGEVVPFSFTSLCRFPLYETDFGWGKPVWVASASLTFRNLVVFMDDVNGGGGGIEAWVNMKEEEMEKFGGDEEFLAFVYGKN